VGDVHSSVSVCMFWFGCVSVCALMCLNVCVCTCLCICLYDINGYGQ
jgi:hypothetical protein